MWTNKIIWGQNKVNFDQNHMTPQVSVPGSEY